MSEQGYRPPRKSAVLENDGAHEINAGDEPAQQQPAQDIALQPTAVLPSANSGGQRPMPRPRNQKPLPAMRAAPTPQFIEPGPSLPDPAITQQVLDPADHSPRGVGQALSPNFIAPNPHSPAGTGPPPYQQPLQPYQLQPGAPATNPLGQQSLAKIKVPAKFRAHVQSSYMFCTTWRGIIEITARVAVMVLAVFGVALSAAIIKTVQSNEYLDLILMVTGSGSPVPETQALIRGSESVAGFVMFLGIVCFIVQIPTIVGRFNLKGGASLLFVLHVVDAVASGLLAVFFLCAAIAAASNGGQWGEPPLMCTEGFIDTVKDFLERLGLPSTGITFSCDEETLAAQLGGLATIGFIGGGLTIFLTVWTVYTLYAKWDYASNLYKENEEANVSGN